MTILATVFFFVPLGLLAGLFWIDEVRKRERTKCHKETQEFIDKTFHVLGMSEAVGTEPKIALPAILEAISTVGEAHDKLSDEKAEFIANMNSIGVFAFNLNRPPTLNEIFLAVKTLAADYDHQKEHIRELKGTINTLECENKHLRQQYEVTVGKNSDLRRKLGSATADVTEWTKKHVDFVHTLAEIHGIENPIDEDDLLRRVKHCKEQESFARCAISLLGGTFKKSFETQGALIDAVVRKLHFANKCMSILEDLKTVEEG